MKSLNPRLIGLVAAAAVVLIVLGIVLVSRDDTSDASDETAAATTTSSVDTDAGPSERTTTTTAAPATTESTVDDGDSGFTPPEPEPLPLDISVSSTEGLHDGDTVSVHVTPQAGSSIFGIEAFLCQTGTTYLLDADIRPTQTGKCITKRLSPSSNDYIQVAVAPPYQSADLQFRVGVGSDTYATQEGREATITCGPGNPCDLVLKLQVPNTFGFRQYTVTYA